MDGSRAWRALRYAITGSTDVVDVSVALCARDRGHSVVTTNPADIAAIDPAGLTIAKTLSGR
jgi:hypothetical protein